MTPWQTNIRFVYSHKEHTFDLEVLEMDDKKQTALDNAVTEIEKIMAKALSKGSDNQMVWILKLFLQAH